MPTYGIGNFAYEVVAENGNAKYKFWDPEDAGNTAEVSIASSDFPEGVGQADSREVADLAYGKCEKQLNSKRDARRKGEAEEQLEKQTSAEARSREAGNSFLHDAEHGTSKPDKVEKDKDGNVISNVYSGGGENTSTENKDKK